MYKLSQSINCNLKKITPRVLKSAKEKGVIDLEQPITENFKLISSSFLDSEKLKELLNIIFDYDFTNISEEEIENIDLEEVSKAYIDFFLKLSTSITESENFKKILKNLS